MGGCNRDFPGKTTAKFTYMSGTKYSPITTTAHVAMEKGVHYKHVQL